MAAILEPYAQILLASTALTATANGSTLEVPLLDDYTFLMDVSSTAGTSPTLDMNIQITVDKGTTWFNVARFARVTADGTRKLIVFPFSKGGAAASVADLTKLEASIVQAGNAVISGFAPMTSKLRLSYAISGTSPSFTTVVWVIGNPRQQ